MVSCQRNQDPATNTLSEMCERLFPQHAHSFQFQLLTDSVDIDRFTLESDNGKILIKGNNRNSLAVGLNHYLKYYYQAHVSWYASDSVVMPAQLPEVAIKKPQHIIGKNTVEGMQSGVVYGYIGLTEKLIEEIKSQYPEPLKVVSTGGLGRMIYQETNLIDAYDKDLTFKGLKIIYDMQKRD